jgi:hypothetical protein
MLVHNVDVFLRIQCNAGCVGSDDKSSSKSSAITSNHFYAISVIFYQFDKIISIQGFDISIIIHKSNLK